MAVNTANLVWTQYNPGQPGLYQWTYTTSDNLSTVDGTDYWDGAAKMIRTGDVVLIVANDGVRVQFMEASGNLAGADPVVQNGGTIRTC